MVYCYRLFNRLTINRGLENKGVIKAFSQKYNIKQVQILAYNSKANRVVEQGYCDILNRLSKVIYRGFKN
ncbi:hypothetical protein PZA11_001880 [Diplocarpon coronariae]